MSLELASREDVAYEMICDSLFNLEIDRGERLLEGKLAEELGMSRTPVRAALKRLVQDGVVKYTINNGFYVAAPTDEEIVDAYSVRKNLEIMAAELAAKRITPESIRKLEALIKQETIYYDSKQFSQFFRTNKEIHLEIARAGGNATLVEFVEKIVNKTTLFQILYNQYDREATNTSEAEHEAILLALKEGNAGNAGRAMEAHLVLSQASMNPRYAETA